MKNFFNRWFQFSKIVVGIGITLFVIVLYFCLTNKIQDTSIAMSLLTITGGIMASSFAIYANKHKFEEVAYTKLEHVKQISKIEYESLEKRLKLMKKYGFTENDIIKAQEFTRLDDMASDYINADTSYLNDKSYQAEQDVEFRTSI